MARDRYAYAATSSSARPLIQRGIIVLLLVTGITLLVLSKMHHNAAGKIRLQLLDMMNPVMGVVSKPVSGMRNLFHGVADYQQTVEENRRLKTENESLLHWQSVALELKAENEALRKLMDYHPADNVSYVTARVVGESPGSYSNSLMINAGADQGVKDLMPVVDSYGLVGRTLDVGKDASRVLLLSDMLSRVPVITSTTRQHAILSGTGTELLRLSFLTVEQQGTIQLGEQVVTTAEGGLVPGGIIIGTVFKEDKGTYLIKPLRPLTQAEYLRVMVLN